MILFCRGQSLTAIQKYMDLADIQFVSDTVYHKYLSSIVIPTVNMVFQECMQQVLKDVKAQVKARRKPTLQDTVVDEGT